MRANMCCAAALMDMMAITPEVAAAKNNSSLAPFLFMSNNQGQATSPVCRTVSNHSPANPAENPSHLCPGNRCCKDDLLT